MGVWSSFDVVAMNAAMLSPLVIGTTIAWSLRRSRGLAPRERRRRVLWNLLVVLTFYGLAAVTLHPMSGGIDGPRSGLQSGVQLVPFVETTKVITSSVSAGVAMRIVGLNVALFIPVGFVLALRTGRWGFSVGAAILTSVTIEVLQAVLPLGRTTNVDDVILNAAGAVIGASCALALRRVRHSPATTAPEPSTITS